MRVTTSLIGIAVLLLAEGGRSQSTPAPPETPLAGDISPVAAAECDLRTVQPQPPWNLSVQDSVAEGIERSAACLAQDDAACADAALAAIGAQELGADEKALLAVQYAELASLRGNSESAESELRAALELPALSPFLARDVAQKIAALLIRRADYVGVLRLLSAHFSCETWTADALTLRALAYEQLAGTTFALVSFEAAIRLYRLQNRALPAGLEERYRSLAAGYDPALAASHDIVPLFRAAPDYPALALRRGREGWVQLEFTIAATGAVENVRPVASSDTVFEAAAAAALGRWRYPSTFENGLPVPRHDVQTIIRFCIDDCEADRSR